MGLYSRQKGKRGERMVRDLFVEHGFPARRGQQFQGSPDSPDVVVPDLEWIHVESKFVEKLDLNAAVVQAAKDAGEKFPVVFHKKSNKDWLVTMSVEDFFELVTMIHDEKQKETNCKLHSTNCETPVEQVEDKLPRAEPLGDRQ